jgi:SPOR domain
MKFRFLLVIGTLMLFISVLQAQENADAKASNIFEALAATDSTSHATVTIHQDKRIEALLVNKKSLTVSGFRVQVFSSNIQRTAKNNAFGIEKQIQEVFPNQPVYVNYTSPFWKVRVGDFKTKAEAQAFRNQLIESLPTLKSEIYVVPEQINVSPSK